MVKEEQRARTGYKRGEAIFDKTLPSANKPFPPITQLIEYDKGQQPLHTHKTPLPGATTMSHR